MADELKNILLVSIARLGDILQASPIIAGLKAENPQARITVVIDRSISSVCRGIPGIDDAYELDLSYLCRHLNREQEGIVDAFSYVTKVVDELRARHFDCCINLSNSPYTALLVKLLGIERTSGWRADDEGCRVLDTWSMLFAASVYHSNRNFNAINLVDIFRCSAGVNKHPRSLQFQFSEKAARFAERFLVEHGIEAGGPLICIQAGASQKKRQWEPERFAILSRMLVNELGARIVYTGLSDEREVIQQIERDFTHSRAVSAAGATDLDQLAALLARAELLITGDTGTMHLSVAVGTPVIALFLASAFCFETGPYSAGNLVIQPQISCRPCNPNLPCAGTECHAQITPELVKFLSGLRLQIKKGSEHMMREQMERIPGHLADPREVVVYRSDFDSDGFLYFAPISADSSSASRDLRNHAARNAYRRLWKEELLQVLPEDQDVQVAHASGFETIAGLCEKAMATLHELEASIRDKRTRGVRLGEIERQLRSIFQSIEQFSYADEMVSLLVRMFVLEKEHVQGSDAISLARAEEEVYARLGRRSRRLSALLS